MAIIKCLLAALLVLACSCNLEASETNPEPPVRIGLRKSLNNPNDASPQLKETYYAEVNLGQPAQPFKLAIDTATYESWLPQYTWNPFANNLHYRTGYKRDASESALDLGKSITTTYRDTKISGKMYTDQLHFKLPNWIEETAFSTNWTFLAVSSASDKQFSEALFDGVLGMARTKPIYVEHEGGAFDLFNSIEKEQRPKELIFALWYSSDELVGGELHLGGINNDMIAEGSVIHYHNIAMVNIWMLEAQQVDLDTQYAIKCNEQHGNCFMLLDSAMSDAYAPREEIVEIYKLLGAQLDLTSGLHVVDCDKVDSLPTLKFTIKRTLTGPSSPDLVFKAKDYIRVARPGSKLHQDNKCYVAIYPNPGKAMPKNGWVLGTSFMKSYYTVFDIMARKIGLAEARG